MRLTGRSIARRWGSGESRALGRPVLVVATIAALLAGCQPLPHPFAEQKVPIGSRLLPMSDSAGVSVDPVRGEPRAIAQALAPAIAEALQKRDIPASDKSTSLASYVLVGTLQEEAAGHSRKTLVVLWQLRDPKRRPVGAIRERIAAPPEKTLASARQTVTQLAADSALHLLPLLQPAAPREAKRPQAPQVRLAAITGAPGDGDRSLATAITTLLAAQHVMATGAAQKEATLILSADVRVDAAKDRKQHVTIVWHLRHAGGGEIGQVSQANDIPAGQLDGAWGQTAYAVAVAAKAGVMALIERGNAPGNAPGPHT